MKGTNYPCALMNREFGVYLVFIGRPKEQKSLRHHKTPIIIRSDFVDPNDVIKWGSDN